MPRIVLNSISQPSEPACRTWGDLMSRLDQCCAESGTVLTAVRFDGVDQPAFRDPVIGRQVLDGVDLIEADSASPRELLVSSLDQAVAAAGTLASAAERVGAAFRGFDVTHANQDLVELAQGLGTLVAIVQALSQAMGLDLAAVSCSAGTGAEMIDELARHADALIASQQSEDWITVADVIEYDIAPALRTWPGLFDALRASMPPESGTA